MVEPRRLSSDAPGFERELERLLAFEGAQDESVERATAAILDDVRDRGDAALMEYTARFDRWSPTSVAAMPVAGCRPRSSSRANVLTCQERRRQSAS